MSNFDTTRILTDPAGLSSGAGDRTMIAPGPAGATAQLPMGGGDAFRTQMGSVISCPVCKGSTPMFETYCGDCGFLLTSPVAEELVVPVEEPAAAELVDLATGRRYRLRAGVNTVGRQGTDVLVDDGTVSRAHARITIEAGIVTVEDLGSSNGSKVGDVRIGAGQPTVATAGTVLRFGTWKTTLEMGPSNASSLGTANSDDRTIVVSDGMSASDTADTVTVDPEPVLAAASAAETGRKGAEDQRRGRLQRLEGPGVDIDIFSGAATIGRKSGNTIAIAGDAFLSGRHAEISADATGIFLVDVGSSNGTLVNGQKLLANDRQLLVEGDEIKLGQTTYRFEPYVPVIADLPSLDSPNVDLPDTVDFDLGSGPTPVNEGSDAALSGGENQAASPVV